MIFWDIACLGERGLIYRTIVMRSNLKTFLAILLFATSRALSLVPFEDQFSGTSINSVAWEQKNPSKGTSSFSVNNGRLNFYVSTATIDRTENETGIWSKIDLPTNQSWSVMCGLHNSASFSLNNGASQMQFAIVDETLSCFLGASLFREKNLATSSPLLGLESSSAPHFWDANGIRTTGSIDASIKISYDKTTQTLTIYTSTDGNNPSANNYNWRPLGSLVLNSNITPRLKAVIASNVYDVSVSDGQMWADNFQINTEPTNLPVDTMPPTISLLGINPFVVYSGQQFTDPGATVNDNIDLPRTIYGIGTVDVSQVGVYTLSYTASDTAGNSATPITRTVNVINDPSTDTDGDCLTDVLEAVLGTNPLLKDTDGDSVNDGLENNDGTNPLDNKSFNVLNTGLIAYYPFNGNADDQSGNGNHGNVDKATLDNDIRQNAGKAYKFNSSVYASITVPDSNSLRLTNISSFSISIMAKLNKDGVYLIAKDIAGGSFPKWIFGYAPTPWNTNSELFFHIANYSNPGAYIASSPNVNLVNTGWHHLVYTRSNNVHRMYKDGQILRTETNNTPMPESNNASLTIGCAEWSGHVDGWLDQVRIYNRALSDSEIIQLYTNETHQGQTNTYALILQQSYDLQSWSSISTNTITDPNPSSFFRVKIQKQ